MSEFRTKALVTGGTGLVGAALAEELRSVGGYDVVALGREDANLMDAAATRAAFQSVAPDIVFHVAARVAGLGGNMKSPGEMFHDNLIINTNVIEAARLAQVRKVVAVGSAAIYSDTVLLPMSEDEVWAGPPHSSEAAYGHAKRAMLANLEAYEAQYGLQYAYCILTNTFGPGDKFDEQYGHVLPSLISKFHRGLMTGGSVTVWGTGTPSRDFLYSKDVARALRLIGERGSGAINVASGTEITIRELVDLVRRVSGYQGVVNWDSEKPSGQELRRYDTSRLRALGFATRYNLETAVTETFEWFRANNSAVRR